LKLKYDQQRSNFAFSFNVLHYSKGIYCFDYCHSHSMFISAGVERDIMLWHGNTGHKAGGSLMIMGAMHLCLRWPRVAAQAVHMSAHHNIPPPPLRAHVT